MEYPYYQNPKKFSDILDAFQRNKSISTLTFKVTDDLVLHEFLVNNQIGYYTIDKILFESLASDRFDIKKKPLFWIVTDKSK